MAPAFDLIQVESYTFPVPVHQNCQIGRGLLSEPLDLRPHLRTLAILFVIVPVNDFRERLASPAEVAAGRR